MIDEENLKFNSPELQAAYEKTRPIIERQKEIKRKVDRDIKSFEALLQSTGTKKLHRAKLDDKNELFYDPQSKRLNICYAGEMIRGVIQSDFAMREKVLKMLPQFLEEAGESMGDE